MTTGIVFDIKEFAVHDGPGIRTTVFMKGCPLKCIWCHNPEGQSHQPQIIRSPAGERIAGGLWTPEDLARRLNQQADILKSNEGGITFSGGEPLLQSVFVSETIDLLDHLHILLDTSGYGSPADFRRLLDRTDLVYFDLKLIDPAQHLYYTGCVNEPILKNLKTLGESGIPFVVRVPLVPGVTDTDANLEEVAKTIQGLPGLQRVDLLPYNRAAGAKYEYLGMAFLPEYDEERPLNINIGIFERMGIEVKAA